MFDRIKIRLTIPLAYHNNLFKKNQVVEACFRCFEKPHVIGVNWLPCRTTSGSWSWRRVTGTGMTYSTDEYRILIHLEKQRITCSGWLLNRVH